MRKDDLIPIRITNAKVTSVAICYEEGDIPTIGVELSLMDEGERKITSITVRNKGWGTHNKMELTVLAVELAAKVKKELELCATRYMNSYQRAIEVTT